MLRWAFVLAVYSFGMVSCSRAPTCECKHVELADDASAPSSARENEFDFGSVRWGMSVEEVQAKYPDQTIECKEEAGDATCSGAKTELVRAPFETRFHFYDGRLVSIYASTSWELDVWWDLPSALQRKYGPFSGYIEGEVEPKKREWLVRDGRTKIVLDENEETISLFYGDVQAIEARYDRDMEGL